MDRTQTFAQGARCGHVEGKGRAGQYLTGEEIEASWDAAVEQKLPPVQSADWERGYRHGYLLAAEGSDLEPELRLG